MKKCINNSNINCPSRPRCRIQKCTNPKAPISQPEETANLCDHKDTTIVVLAVVANCEKTAIQCDYCGEILTEPKTDCR